VQFHCSDIALKIATNFSDDIHSLNAFRLKFTINANIVYIPVEATSGMSTVCIYRSYKLLKTVRYFWPALYVGHIFV